MRKILLSFLLVMISSSLIGCKKDEVIRYETTENIFYYDYTMHEGETKQFLVLLLPYEMTPTNDFIQTMEPYEDQLVFDRAEGTNLDLIDLAVDLNHKNSTVRLLKQTDKTITIDKLIYKIKGTNDEWIIRGTMIINCDSSYTGVNPKFPLSYVPLTEDELNRGNLIPVRSKDAYAYLITADELLLKNGFNFDRSYSLQIQSLRIKENSFYTVELVKYALLGDQVVHHLYDYIDKQEDIPNENITIDYTNSRYGTMLFFDLKPKEDYTYLFIGLDLIFDVIINGDEYSIYREIILS